MGKTKILKEHEGCSSKQLQNLRLEDFENAREIDPLKELCNSNQTALAVFECLRDNDPGGAMEMIEIYLEAMNKSKLIKKSKLPKSTLYSSLKHRNPTIRTLAKIMSRGL